MSLSKRSYEFLNETSETVAVRNKRVKKRFSIDVNFPSFTTRRQEANTVFSFGSEVLYNAVEKLPRFVVYHRHSGDFTPSFSGIELSSKRESEECVYEYREKWLADLQDVRVLMTHELFKYDPASGNMDLVEIMTEAAVTAKSGGFIMIQRTVDDIENVSRSAPTELERIVTPIEKPAWVDEAIASHAQATGARA